MLTRGQPPFKECSSKGDTRYSAFFARLRCRENRSIEEVYQAAKVFEDGSTNKHWRDAKGKRAVNDAEVRLLYRQLWDEYFFENPQLLDELQYFTGVADLYGREDSCCQAATIWDIMLQRFPNKAALASGPVPPSKHVFAPLPPPVQKHVIPLPKDPAPNKNHITIWTTPQSYRIKVDNKGELIGPQLSLNKYCSRFIERKWDQQTYRWIENKKYRYHDHVTEILYLPRYDLPRFTHTCDEHGITYTIVEVPLSKGVPIKLAMKPWFAPKDDRQAKTIDYLTYAEEPLRGLALQTGGGKSAASLKTISNLGVRAMICVPTLVEQWKAAIFKFTEATPDDVVVIQGMTSLANLLQKIDKKVFPKIILISIPTLQAYCNGRDSYVNFPPFDELLNRLGVGIRIVDEAHLRFHANLLLDLRLNAAITLIMTATFEVNDADIAAIFNGHYPASIRYGEGDYKRYANVYAYAYHLYTGDVPSRFYQGAKGYNHGMFETWLLNKGHVKLRQIVDKVYYPIIRSLYLDKVRYGERLLVLCSTTAMCEFLCDEFTKGLPQFRSTIYVSETDDSVLKDHDIIISTLGSAGTGRDIDNLLTMLNTISIRASGTQRQNLGRLRELKDPPRTPSYAYCYCTTILAHTTHADIREKVLQPLALNYYKHEM